MIDQHVYAVCREPFISSDLWYIRLHALLFVDGEDCENSDFPDNNGDIFWMLGKDKPDWVQSGALCTLQVEKSKRDKEPGQCWYQAVRDTVHPVSVELVDLSSEFASEHALLRFREFRVPWSLPQRVYIRLDRYVYGPFRVKQQNHRASFVENPKDNTYFRYGWQNVYDNVVRPVYISQDEERWIIQDEDKFQQLERIPRDVRTDEQLVKWYLRSLRDADNVPQEIRDQLTRRAIQKAASAYSFFYDDLDLVEHRIERLETFGHIFNKIVQQQPSIIEMAMGKAFDLAVQSRIDDIVQEKNSAITDQMKPLEVELKRLQKENIAAARELATTRTRMAEESEAFKQSMDVQMQHVKQLRQHLADDRERLLHDFWALSGLLGGDEVISAVAAAQSVDPWKKQSDNSAVVIQDTPLTEPKQLADQLSRAFSGGGEELAMIKTLHTLVIEQPIFGLSGEYALQCIQRYAHALGPATRVHQVVVEAGWVNLEPLFGKVNPRTRRFEPAPGGTFEFWTKAMHLAESASGGLQILVLHEANRSPIDVWLAKVLFCALDPNDYSIPLFHERQVSQQDEYLDCATLILPPNLRVVCLMVDDEFSYQPSDSLQKRFPIAAIADGFSSNSLADPSLYESVFFSQLLDWDWNTIWGIPN